MTEFLDSWRIEQGHLVRKRQQPLRDHIVQRNQELQKNPGAVRHTSFGGMELIVPLLDLHLLQEKYPDLASPDPEIKTRAWKRFMGSSEADPYRVRPRRRARANMPVSMTPVTMKG